MSRFLVFLVTAMAFSFSAYGETSNPICRANVECKGLFNDLLTEKFLAKFPPEKWAVFIHADTYLFGDGKATSHAVVGVVPVTKEAFAYSYFPNQTSSQIITTPRISSAYGKKDVERKAIRRAIESLMATCEERKNCDLE